MAVQHYGTEAYDLSLFEPKQAEIVELKPNKKTKKVQKRRLLIQTAVNTVLTLLIAGMAAGVLGTMISSRVQLTEMNAVINQKEEELQVLQTEYVRITNELSQKTSAQSVQEYATGTLGMQKLEPYQIEYITVEDTVESEAKQAKETGVFRRVGESVSKFFTRLAYLFG